MNRPTMQAADMADVVAGVRRGFYREPPFEAVLDVDEAARLLHLSPYTIREKARKGEIPARKLGEWRFSRDALLRWLEGGRPRPMAASAWESARLHEDAHNGVYGPWGKA